MAYADAQTTGARIDYGDEETTIVLAGTVYKGDAIGYSAGWKQALATVGGVIQMRCVAAEDGQSGQRIKAYFGKVILSGSRFSGATAGGALYVAESTSVGKYTQTLPSTTGDATKVVGYALNATEAILLPNVNADSVA